MSRRLLVLVSGLALACVVLIGSKSHAQSDPPGVNRTHYWTYSPQYAHFQPTNVSARDQFFLGYTPILLDSLTRFINWVHKNNSPVEDTPINVHDLDFMLVPAWKNQPQPGNPLANHYLCYRAQGGPPPPTFYQLEDEWRTDVQHPGPLQYLCVPCWKEHAGAIYSPVDTLTHLALYPIQPISDWFYPYIQDQFFAGNCQVRQQPIEYLMVPSIKDLIPTKTVAPTWGRLKSIYR